MENPLKMMVYLYLRTAFVSHMTSFIQWVQLPSRYAKSSVSLEAQIRNHLLKMMGLEAYLHSEEYRQPDDFAYPMGQLLFAQLSRFAQLS